MTATGERRVALVVGATGIFGQAISSHLIKQGYRTHGLSRSGDCPVAGVSGIAADLLDATAVRAALSDIAPEFVAITAWVRKDCEDDNIVVNSAIVRNVLDGCNLPGQSVTSA